MSVSLPRKIWRVFKSMGVVGWSKKKNLLGANPMFISSAFILLTLALASLLRKTVHKTLSDNLIKVLLLEFLATLELCAACFELIIVADNWGIEAYALSLFLLTIYWSSCWGNASACPYIPMEELVEGSKNLSTVGLIVLSQILGGLVTFRYVQLFWAMELVETHRGKAFEDCAADLHVNKFCSQIKKKK
ncbi:unnamed protein product [Brassicogethes aeneus]|uniref:Uncharacterized protein n=1 Tax=Brassicogethes aeneus TaxID=1431903 RepID=A0A9P0BFW3_BRAAE|nr:unnamed protein product [Brassicogethes aeneus]